MDDLEGFNEKTLPEIKNHSTLNMEDITDSATCKNSL